MAKLTKDDIVQICSIYSWNPSDTQFSKIIEEITTLVERGRKIDNVELHDIILKYCPATQFYCVEGVDNSDINTLLLLAMKNQGK